MTLPQVPSANKSHSSRQDSLFGIHRDSSWDAGIKSEQLENTVAFTQNKEAYLGLKSKLLPAEWGLLENQKPGQSLLSTYS